MKSSDSGASRFLRRKPNFFMAVLAVIVAIILWVLVSRRDWVETEIEINIDYNSIPANLVVTDGQVNKLLVRLRGPEPLLRSLSRDHINYPINLSDIKKGDNIIPLSPEKLGARMRAFSIIDIQPSRIEIIADALAQKTVPLRVEFDSPLSDEALTIENQSASPSTVILRGPEKVLADISVLPVIVRPDPKITGKPQKVEITLDTQSFVTATPSIVTVQFTITSGRRELTREVPVSIAGDLLDHYQIEPKAIKLLLEVPEALSRDNKYLDQCKASVAPPPMQEGEILNLPITIVTPEGMKILSHPQKEVMVKKIKN